PDRSRGVEPDRGRRRDSVRRGVLAADHQGFGMGRAGVAHGHRGGGNLLGGRRDFLWLLSRPQGGEARSDRGAALRVTCPKTKAKWPGSGDVNSPEQVNACYTGGRVASPDCSQERWRPGEWLTASPSESGDSRSAGT